MQGKYEREDWFEKLEKNLRAEDLNEEQKKKFLESNKKIVDGTSYKNFLYGKGVGWNIEINYLYKGVYSGTVDYPKYWGNKNESTKVAITLNINNDLTTGSGTYSYIQRNDFGTYAFQISELDSNKIIIRYKNTLPSGIAEGYEIWRRIKAH